MHLKIQTVVIAEKFTNEHMENYKSFPNVKLFSKASKRSCIVVRLLFLGESSFLFVIK